MSEAASYNEVPIPAREPVPERALRATAILNTLPQKGGAGAGASSSCPVQEHNCHNPSDIAKDALISFLDLPKTDSRHQYDSICSEFVEYLDRSEQKGFMVKGYETVKGKMINLPMSYDNRWGTVRRRELSEKLKRLEFWFEMQEDRPVTMITLTSYHEGMTMHVPLRIGKGNRWRK